MPVQWVKCGVNDAEVGPVFALKLSDYQRAVKQEEEVAIMVADVSQPSSQGSQINANTNRTARTGNSLRADKTPADKLAGQYLEGARIQR